MDKQDFQDALKAAIDAQGGTLANGWAVTVKQRASGTKDLRISAADGKVYRSLKQAVAAFLDEEVAEDEQLDAKEQAPDSSPVHITADAASTGESTESDLDKADGLDNVQPSESQPALQNSEPTKSDNSAGGQHVVESAQVRDADEIEDAREASEAAGSAGDGDVSDGNGAEPALGTQFEDPYPEEQGTQSPLRRSARVKKAPQPAKDHPSKENKSEKASLRKGTPRHAKQVLTEKSEQKPAAKATKSGSRPAKRKQPRTESEDEGVIPTRQTKKAKLAASKPPTRKPATQAIQPEKQKPAGHGKKLKEADAKPKKEAGKEPAPLRRSTRGQKAKQPEATGNKQEVVDEAKKPKSAGKQRGAGVKKAKKSKTAKPPASGPPTEHPVFGRLIAKAKRHTLRIRRELDCLDVYKAEGWMGANKDRLKQPAEIQRAEEQIEKSKDALRGILRRCQAAEGRRIPEEHYDDNGDLDQEHIFCAVCDGAESLDENDILLCDGPCGRAYHEKCCIPPIQAADLSEDSDWLCAACHAKDEVLDMISEAFEFRYELDCNPEAVFNETGTIVRKDSKPGESPARKGGEGTWAFLLGCEDLVSSDSGDQSFGEEDVDETSASDQDGSLRESASEDAEENQSTSKESDGSLAEGDEADVLESKRPRRTVDYVEMNTLMFGEEDEHQTESSDEEWS